MITHTANDSDKTPEKGTGGQPAVLIVGAGPTGLLLASELHRRGVPCHLIDSRPAPMHWDRATVVHPRSLQIFESLGLAQKFLDAGCRQRAVKIHSNGKLLGKMELSSCGSSYGFNIGLSEEVTESILTEYLEQLGGTVNQSSRLLALTQRGDSVLAEIERNGERYQVNTRWAVGCDGIHSPTREMSGIGFEGHDILKPWAVFDATLKNWTDTYEATFVYFGAIPPSSPQFPATAGVSTSGQARPTPISSKTRPPPCGYIAPSLVCRRGKSHTIPLPHQNSYQLPLWRDLSRRRRRTPLLASPGPRNELRTAGCLQSRVEARARSTRQRRPRPARQLRSRAPSRRRARRPIRRRVRKRADHDRPGRMRRARPGHRSDDRGSEGTPTRDRGRDRTERRLLRIAHHRR